MRIDSKMKGAVVSINTKKGVNQKDLHVRPSCQAHGPASPFMIMWAIGNTAWK